MIDTTTSEASSYEYDHTKYSYNDLILDSNSENSNIVLVDNNAQIEINKDGNNYLIYGKVGKWKLQNYQLGFSDCGLASIRNVLLEAGLDISEDDIIKTAMTGIDGIKLCKDINNDGKFDCDDGETDPVDRLKILEKYGIGANIVTRFSMDQLANYIKEGAGIILSVSAELLDDVFNPPPDYASSLPPDKIKLNHVVTVVGAKYLKDSSGQEFLESFYICDSASWPVYPLIKEISIDNLYKSCTLVNGFCEANVTNDNIKNNNTESNDLYAAGNEFDNKITGNSGNNILFGWDGSDTLIGGLGSDEIHGGEDDDIIYGNDTIVSSDDGKNALYGDSGNDKIIAGNNNDYIEGGADNDTIVGGQGNSWIIGGIGDDCIFSGTGKNMLEGGSGNDTYNIVMGNGVSSSTNFVGPDNMQFQPLTHTTINDLDGKGSVIADGTTLTGGKAINGSNTTFTDNSGFTYSLSGTTLTISKGDGSFQINDFVNGNLGITLKDQTGTALPSSTISGRNVCGGSGNDVLFGTNANDTIDGQEGNDVIYASAGNDDIKGGTGNNLIYAGEGNNSITGGGGYDTVYAGAGNDTYHCADSYWNGSKWVTSISSHNVIYAGEGNNHIDVGYDACVYNSVYAGAGDDHIWAGKYSYVNAGDGKNDIMVAGYGTVIAGSGDDDIYSSGHTVIYAGDGHNTIVGGGGEDNGGNDTIYAGSDNDYFCLEDTRGGFVVDCGAGDDHVDLDFSRNANDKINFGLGNDTLDLRESNFYLWRDCPEVITANKSTLTTGNGNNTINLQSSYESTIKAGSGNDSIYVADTQISIIDAGEGNNRIVFNTSSVTRNTITAGSGNDSISFIDNNYSNNNSINMGDGNNVISLNKGFNNNTIISGSGNDVINESGYFNIINSGAGNDSISINYSADKDTNNYGPMPNPYTYFGSDTINSGAGDDTISITALKDKNKNSAKLILTDTSGNDTIDLSNYKKSNIKFTLKEDDLIINKGDLIINKGDLIIKNWFKTKNNQIEKFIFSDGIMTSKEINALFIPDTDGDDSLTGTPYNDMMYGGAGNDTINGKDGDDIISGGNDNDVLNGEGGSDTIYGCAGDDAIYDDPYNVNYFYGGVGNDTYYIESDKNVIVENADEGIDSIVSTVSHTLEANVENLILSGIDAINGTGNELDNVITGNSANNVLDGGIGADTLIGRVGDDSYYVRNTDDVIIENANEGTDTVYSSISYTLSDNVEKLTLTGTEAINATGNDLNNTIAGNTANNVFDGGVGDDTYVFNIGSGRDTITDANGINTIQFDAGITADKIAIYNDGDNKVVVYGDSDDRVTIINQVNSNIIETLKFDDGTTYALTTGSFLNSISGTSGDDNLVSETVYGIGFGGSGNDTMSVETSGIHVFEDSVGNENYLIDKGDGTILINDAAGADTITFGTGITKDNIMFSDISGNLVITFKDSTDKITVENQFDSTHTIETFVFADGTSSISSAITSLFQIVGTNRSDTIADSIFSEKIYGNDGDDYIVVKNGGTDSVYGGAGNDTITGSGSMNINGGTGDDYVSLIASSNDNYSYNLGDGNDIISDAVDNSPPYGGYPNNNTITFGVGITKDNIKFMGNGSDVKIVFTDSANDSITLKNQVSGQFITTFVFADGTNYASYEIASLIEFHGTDQDDTLTGSYSNDKIYGEAGNDQITCNGYTENAFGGDGNDTITSQYSSIYADGGDDNDYISGGIGNNTLLGGSGDDIVIGNQASDIIVGGIGNDSLIGGDGDDTYKFSLGYGIDTITDASGTDTLSFGAGITKDNIKFSQDLNNNLIIRFNNSTDKIFVEKQFSSNNIIENFAFSNGTSYTANDISALLVPNNTDPVATLTSATLNEDSSAVLDVLADAADIDGDTLSISAYTQGIHGKIIKNTTNKLIYTPTANYTGADVFTYTISDGKGGTITKTVNLTINATVNITGEKGNDVLAGNSANNVIDGGIGADKMTGGLGNDTYCVDNAGDIVKETSTLASEIDTVNSSITYTLGTNLENLTLLGTAAINGTGNKLNNTIKGNAANNILNGGTGVDKMFGGLGNDTYYVDNSGDAVTETSTLASEIDTVISSSTYSLSANVENLTLTGKAAINGTGNDLDNMLIGNAGANVLIGGLGNDTYYVDNARDVVIETPTASNEIDTVISSSTYSLSANVENLTLTGKAAINGTGNTLNNTITGNTANNILNGGIGADKMLGGLGNDTYYVDNADDEVTETSTSAKEIDTVVSSVTYTLGANVENLALAGINAIYGSGNNLNNTITGNAANNVIDGGIEADKMTGGLGNDTYYVDNAGDIVKEISTLASEIDTVNSSITYTLGTNLENLTLLGTAAINGTGNKLNNTITGNAANNILNGGTGVDKMLGGLGNDTYYVDNSGDAVTETSTLASEIDTVISSSTYSLSANVENLTLTGKAAINGTGNDLDNTLIGNAGANVLTGGAGNDTVDGGAGADKITGGIGNDLLLGGNGNDVYQFDSGDGLDKITDASGTDAINFGSTVSKSNIAMYLDLNNNLIIDYGSTAGSDQIKINSQNKNTIEKINLSDGEYITSSQINRLIQNMTAYANANGSEFTGISSVKNNQELMNLVVGSWHSL